MTAVKAEIKDTPRSRSRTGRSAGRHMMRHALRIGAPILLAFACLAAWQLYVRLDNVPEIVLPTPTQIISATSSQLGTYLPEAETTSIEVGLGFVIACAAGLVLGIFTALSRILGMALYPIIIASQVLPKIAIAPMMIIWFGFGVGSKLALTALIAFFPVVISTILGMNMTRANALELFRAMGASRRQVFFKLRLPQALPAIFSGFKLASTLAVIGAVIGEFAGANSGLGYLLLLQSGQLKMADAFGNIIFLTVIGLVLFGLVVLAERILVPAHMLREASING